jgi:hypothetical protein
MNFLDGISKWWNNAQGGEVVKDYGLLDDVEYGNINYSTSAVLRKQEDAYCLQIKLTSKSKGRNVKVRLLHFFFCEPGHLLRIIEDTEARIASRQEPHGKAVGPWLTRFLKLVGKQVVHSYGRVDNNPRHNKALNVEMALITEQGGRYWLQFSAGQSDHFDWPVSMLGSLGEALKGSL